MKKRILILILGLCSIFSHAQIPQSFNYQAVVRDNTGEIISNQTVGIRISIHDATASGTIVYQETFSETTNDFGLVNLQIGKGTPVMGSFMGINWGSNPKFLETEIDRDGGTAYISMGTSELLSVPYALYSETSGNPPKWEQSGNNIYYKNGDVGIGLSNPQGELHVISPIIWEGVIFFGTGINDLYVNYAAYLGNGDRNYIVEVTEAGVNPNIYKWSDNNGATWEEDEVEMLDDDYRLGYDGVEIRFDTLDGHTNGDRWYWTAHERPNDHFLVESGTIGIGTQAPDPSAMLDVKSTEKGILIPRMTQEEIKTIENPANGLQAFNLDDDKLYIYILADQVWKEVQYGSGTINSNATYTIGTGGSCANTTVNGIYIDGVALDDNTVFINVTVTTIGNWSINTNIVNGYSFSGSGTFGYTGTIQVALGGTGTPITAQTDNFTATANGNGGTCTFNVIVEPAHICGVPITYGGQSYNTVQIGDQCWMAENLNIGTMINGNIAQTDNGIIEKYCYDNNTSNCDSYGGLYQAGETLFQNVCPDSWHIPSQGDWFVLEDYVDTGTFDWIINGWRGTDAGGNLKDTGTSHWASPNTGATNSSGFTVLPGGQSNDDGSFYNRTYTGCFLTSPIVGFGSIIFVYRMLSFQEAGVYKDVVEGNPGYSVRCVRNY
nr:hypothetical protein [Bacteroidota bacterium]